MEPKADGTEANAGAPAGADGRLLPAAAAAARHAYAPYSRFQVGAAVLAESGAVYTGANVENVSYPVGTCAEAGALAAARTAEGDGLRAVAVLVYAESGGVRQPCAPCGACRQRLAEFNPDMGVTFHTGGHGWITVPARELLPYAFQF